MHTPLEYWPNAGPKSLYVIDNFNASVAHDPLNPYPYYSIADYAHYKGRHADALAYVSKAIGLKADIPEALKLRAWILATSLESNLRDVVNQTPPVIQAGMGGSFGAGRPLRAASMACASRSMALAARSRQVSITLASSA